MISRRPVTSDAHARPLRTTARVHQVMALADKDPQGSDKGWGPRRSLPSCFVPDPRISVVMIVIVQYSLGFSLPARSYTHIAVRMPLFLHSAPPAIQNALRSTKPIQRRQPCTNEQNRKKREKKYHERRKNATILRTNAGKSRG